VDDRSRTRAGPERLIPWEIVGPGFRLEWDPAADDGGVPGTDFAETISRKGWLL